MTNITNKEFEKIYENQIKPDCKSLWQNNFSFNRFCGFNTIIKAI